MKFVKNLSFHRWNYSTILLFAILVPSFTPVLPMHPSSRGDEKSFDHEKEIEQFLEQRQGENSDQYLTRLNVVSSFLYLQKEFYKNIKRYDVLGMEWLAGVNYMRANPNFEIKYCEGVLTSCFLSIWDFAQSREEAVGCLSLSSKKKKKIVEIFDKRVRGIISNDIVEEYLESENPFLRAIGSAFQAHNNQIFSEKRSREFKVEFCASYNGALAELMDDSFIKKIVESTGLTGFSLILESTREICGSLFLAASCVIRESLGKDFVPFGFYEKMLDFSKPYLKKYLCLEKKLDVLYNSLRKRISEESNRLGVAYRKKYAQVFPSDLREKLDELYEIKCKRLENSGKSLGFEMDRLIYLRRVLKKHEHLPSRTTKKQMLVFLMGEESRKEAKKIKEEKKAAKEREKKLWEKQKQFERMEKKRKKKQAHKQRAEALKIMQIRFDAIKQEYLAVVEMGIKRLKKISPSKLRKKTPIYLKIMKDVLEGARAYKKLSRDKKKVIEDKIAKLSDEDQKILEQISLGKQQKKSKSKSGCVHSVVFDVDVLYKDIMETKKKKDDFVVRERDGSCVKKETECSVEISDSKRNATIRLYRTTPSPLKIFKFGVGERICRWNRGEIEIEKIIEEEYNNLEEYFFPVCRSGKEFVVDAGQDDLRRKMFIFHHNFARCVDKYIFKLGIQTRWRNRTKQRDEINISIPGEVEYDDGSKEYGVFTYAFFEENGRMVCYHRCFTHMIKKRLLQERFKLGYWNVNPDGDDFKHLG